MSAIFSWEQIDRDLEKQVFLIESDEGNYGLYSLIWELGYYKGLPVDQKYAFASQLLKELVVDGMLVIEEFENPDFKNKLRTISLNELDSVLNDVTAWYPHRTPMYATELTPKGHAFLDARDENAIRKLNSRLVGNPTDK